ncbi:MAG: SGNH/GDSL hydrolase family protein [Deltaproteobacteria bacterium]
MLSARNEKRWKIGLLLGALLFSLLLAELGTRAYFASFVGPKIYWYGTPWHRNKIAAMAQWSRKMNLVQVHENEVRSDSDVVAYTKYFPGEKKVILGPDGETRYPVRINSRGFRGQDFHQAKAPGETRVLTMGASSTFGYRNRDHQTYPVQLQEILNARDGTAWEVINFAIPHANSANILAMFQAEGAPLAPDWVTVYAGANDSVISRSQTGALAGAIRFLARHFVVAALAQHRFPALPSSEGFLWSEELVNEREAMFIGNLAKLDAAVRAAGGRLVVVTQQLKSHLVDTPELKGITYAEEVDIVRAAVGAGTAGPGSAQHPVLSPFAAIAQIYDGARVMLIHDRLVEGLADWTAENGIPLADARAALDDRRDLLLSWVHLHPDANRVVAETIADVLLPGAEGAT